MSVARNVRAVLRDVIEVSRVNVIHLNFGYAHIPIPAIDIPHPVFAIRRVAGVAHEIIVGTAVPVVIDTPEIPHVQV